MLEIVRSAGRAGWFPEPEAKRLLSLAGIDIPRFVWTRRIEEGEAFARRIGFPVVAKVVSPSAVHKSDIGGVILGIRDESSLSDAFSALQKVDGYAGVLVEETVAGIEIIVGAKIDYQFGPVILLGAGGTLTEIFRDVTFRMAPVTASEVSVMMSELKGKRLFEGYRGKDPVNPERLGMLVEIFSRLIRELDDEIESVDLNPVICSASRCVVADARIMLS
jgi:hypothetical protein